EGYDYEELLEHSERMTEDGMTYGRKLDAVEDVMRLLPVLLICLCKSIQRTLPRSPRGEAPGGRRPKADAKVGTLKRKNKEMRKKCAKKGSIW
ncbi:MAG: hypothetical protein ACFN4H_07985, partial [Prevotella sp.]